MKLISAKNTSAVQIVAIYLWFVNLVGTDSFYSIYALLGLLAVVTLYANQRVPVKMSGKEHVWVGALASVFAIAMILANYHLFSYDLTTSSVIQYAGSFAGGYVVGRNILIYLLGRVCATGAVTGNRTPRSAVRLFTGTVISIALIDFLYLFCCAYPGVLSIDSVGTMRQIMTGSYNNVMPFWHTMTVQLFVKLGMLIFGEINAAVALFHGAQILFMAVCFAYALVTLYQADVPGKYIFVLYLVYALAPYNIVYGVTLWKDVLFGGATLLLSAAFYRILRKIGKNRLLNYIVFILGAMGFCLWRTNGWYSFAVTAAVMAVLLRKKQKVLLWVILAVLLLCWILLNPVLAALDGGEMDLVETFAVPFQQIARYVAYDGWMDEYEKEFLEMAFDLEMLKEVYHPNCVDPVKGFAFRRENLDYIQENLEGYLQLYNQFRIRRPDIFLEAWVEETKGFWSGGYYDPLYDIGVEENTLGIACTVESNVVSECFETYFNTFCWIQILEPLYSIGLHVWTIIACCLVNALRKRSEFLLSISLIVLSVGLWIATPVVAEFRYGYPMILTAPLILAMTMYPRASQE